jgi:hypothetical protein
VREICLQSTSPTIAAPKIRADPGRVTIRARALKNVVYLGCWNHRAGFQAARASRSNFTLSDLTGKPVILAFHPADSSLVCGDQVTLYNEILPEFRKYDAQLLGISVDRVWCHAAFARHSHLHFPLLADFAPKGEVATIPRVRGGPRLRRSPLSRRLYPHCALANPMISQVHP